MTAFSIDDDLTELKRFNMLYVATPYTRYPKGIDIAAIDAANITGRLMLKGLNVYSPIVHTHECAKHAHIDPIDHDLWMRIDKAFMALCDGLIVCTLPGWAESKGVARERDYFKEVNKPIYYLRIG
jgi:Domain of unknown function (DUF1937)